mgnify:CR=1 FL=1
MTTTNKPLPKVAVRILEHPGVHSLDKYRGIEWICWAKDGWSSTDGNDGYKETSLGAIETYFVKKLRGPSDPGRTLSLHEVCTKHLSGNQLNESDIQVLKNFLNEWFESNYLRIFGSRALFSLDVDSFDKDLLKRFDLPADSATEFVAAIADQASGTTEHRSRLLEIARQENEADEEIEAQMEAEAALKQATDQPQLPDKD